MNRSSSHSISWLKEHFATFVSTVVGHNVEPTLPAGYVRFFTPQEMSIIKNMWRSLKCASVSSNKPLLLPGRDVWLFEVLARRENYPTTFLPQISRLTVHTFKDIYKHYYVADTGFIGSIPKILGTESYSMVSSAHAPTGFYNNSTCNCGTCKKGRRMGKFQAKPITSEVNQIFPRMKGSRSLALKIERTPKYWKRAYLEHPQSPMDRVFNYNPPTERKVKQDFSPMDEFLHAAQLTIEVYTDNSPRFIEKVPEMGHITSKSYME